MVAKRGCILVGRRGLRGVWTLGPLKQLQLLERGHRWRAIYMHLNKNQKSSFTVKCVLEAMAYQTRWGQLKLFSGESTEVGTYAETQKE